MNKVLIICFIIFLNFLQTYKGLAQEIYNTNEKSLIFHNWSVKDGLPSNSIRKIEKTSEGFLFIATYNGISFFDGKNFTSFGNHNLNFLETANIYDFCSLDNRNYWIASQNGVFAYDGNIFYVPEGLKPLSNIAIESIGIEKNGTLWLGSTSDGLYKYEKGKLNKIDSIIGFDKSIISLVFVDSNDKVWIGTELGQLYKYNNKKFIKILETPSANGILAAQQDKNGDIYFGSRNGIYLYKNNTISIFSDEINSINDIKLDKNGIIYAATNSGIFYFDNKLKSFVAVLTRNELKDLIIQTIFFDNNNILWIGTYRKGLYQLKVGAFDNYLFEGSEEVPSAILEAKSGKILVSTDEGKIYELSPKGFTNIKIRTDLQGSRIKSIYEDSKNNIWICSYKGLLKLNEGNETLINNINGFTDKTIRDILETSDKCFWVATRQSGIYKIDNQYKVLKTINTSNGLSSNFVMSLTPGKDGKILIATKRGIDILDKDSIVKHYGTANGLSENLVYHVFEDSQGTLFVATVDGLSIIKNGKISVYNKSRGLQDNKIYDVIEDDLGYLWMPTINGIIRLKKSDLDKINQPEIKIPSELFGKEDGLYDPRYVGATTLLKLKNGKIAINTLSGISILNPYLVQSNKSDISLIIKSVSTENSIHYISKQKIELSAFTRQVMINFSLIDFMNPEKVELKYKLEPFDIDWQIPGSDGVAKYTNLPAGDYKFTVKAHVKSKAYQDIEKSANFTIKPAFFETLLFKIIVLLLLLWLIRLIYVMRVKTLQKQKELLEEEVRDRTSEILKQKDAIESHLQELEKQKLEIDVKNEEIIIANNDIEQAYLNLKLLSDLGRDITSYLNLEQIMHIIYQNINGMMDSDLVGIGTYNAENSKVKFVSTFYRGKKLEDIEAETDADKCLLSYALVNGREIITSDIKNDYPEFIKTFPKLTSFMGVSSMIAIPLKTKGHTNGIFTVQSFRRNSYSEYHFSLLRNLAVYISIALDNAKNYLKLSEQKIELQNVNNSKDKMFSIIGHDLRGPVGTIKQFLDLLVENPEMTNSDNTMKILKTMQQSLGSAYTLLDNLLVWARNQRGQIEYNPVSFAIREPVEDSISLVLETSKSKGLSIISEIDCNDDVYGDKMMITTVLRNLISNAIKFTPTKGKILIKVTKKLQKFANGYDECIEIQVIDTGVGIDENMIEKILKPNELITTPGTDREQGLGLGMSICIDFLNKHKKQLFIEKNCGKNGKPKLGTTFKFCLDKA